MTNTRLALEQALVAHPGDRSLHAAYADCLIEAGDPLGEYLHLSQEERQTAVYKRPRWLGKFHYFLDGQHAPTQVTAAWQWGWIDVLEMHTVSPALVEAILACPLTRLIRSLVARGGADDLQPAHASQLFTFLSQTPLDLLILEWPSLGDEVVVELVRTGLIDRLRELNLSHGGLTDDGAFLLAESALRHRDLVLRLEGNLFSPIGLDALQQAGVDVASAYFSPGSPRMIL